MNKLPAFIIISLLMLAAACYYDNEEYLYPSVQQAGSCDTSQVTFSGTISPILQNNCWACHANTTAGSFGNNIKLQDYADVKNHIQAVAGSINHDGNYSPMPKNGNRLDDCLIRKVEIWMEQGTPDN
jgi:uncharacterized membrane protein